MSAMNANKSKSTANAIKKRKKAKVQVFHKKKRATPESEVIQQLQAKYASINTSEIRTFSDLPISGKTQKGLREAGYKKPTEIQLETIGLALQGSDILGAAQTGSGKTLAFLIPILEVLFCKQWTHLDGVGALIITPTRELAYQIFETLRKIGQYHDFSAGLIIGGKDLKFERRRMDQCNIVVCTPGRLLQHMDENPLFDCVNMQILVLDEADRCLDMGFSQTMNAIIANLPPARQTLLFSATQTKSVKDLARLSLKDPSYVAVHEKAEFSTPVELEQNYVVCNLEDKIPILWSFIRNHLKQKSIIFLSTCHQVKYVYDIFCRLRPGVSLLPLYGTLHQQRRMAIYDEFSRKSAAVLFATDLVSRGLDFPAVHWVVHADCPEDVDAYIHRSGRTARYHRGGESLLLLVPSEVAMVEQLKQRKIPINKIDINPNKLQNPVRKMEAFLARDPEMKERAKRAFVSYGKSVFLMRNKNVFNFEALNMEAFSKSLGLAITPKIRYIEKCSKAAQKKADKVPKIEFKADEDADTPIEIRKPAKPTAAFQMADDSDDDDILKVKRQDHDIDLPSDSELQMNEFVKNKKKKAVTKVAMAKKVLKKNIKPNKKVVFDDDGNPVMAATKEKQSELARQYENENVGGIDFEKAREVLREEDKFDKQLFKQKVKAKHKEKKRKLKEQNKKKEEEEEDVDEFGSESGDEPDLSWLPDPDKIYGNAGDNESDGHGTENESVVEEIAQPEIKMKRKHKEPGLQKKKKQKIDKLTSHLSVNHAEELALILLNNK